MLRWFTRNNLANVGMHFLRLAFLSVGLTLLVVYAIYGLRIIFDWDESDADFYADISAYITYAIVFYTVLAEIYNRETNVIDRRYIFAILAVLFFIVDVIWNWVGTQNIDFIYSVQILLPFMIVYGYKYYSQK